MRNSFGFCTRFFDEQIINYGAYNLVYATGRAVYRNPDLALHQYPDQQHFIVGYQDAPDEVIIAPVNLPGVDACGYGDDD